MFREERCIDSFRTRSHRSLSSPPSPSEGKLEGRNHAVPAWCNLIRKDGKSAARIGASNVNTCRLDIFVTSKDSDRNRGNRRYARETPPPWIADISRICKRILAIHIYRICGTPPFVCFKLPLLLPLSRVGHRRARLPSLPRRCEKCREGILCCPGQDFRHTEKYLRSYLSARAEN